MPVALVRDTSYGQRSDVKSRWSSGSEDQKKDQTDDMSIRQGPQKKGINEHHQKGPSINHHDQKRPVSNYRKMTSLLLVILLAVAPCGSVMTQESPPAMTMTAVLHEVVRLGKTTGRFARSYRPVAKDRRTCLHTLNKSAHGEHMAAVRETPEAREALCDYATKWWDANDTALDHPAPRVMRHEESDGCARNSKRRKKKSGSAVRKKSDDDVLFVIAAHVSSSTNVEILDLNVMSIINLHPRATIVIVDNDSGRQDLVQDLVKMRSRTQQAAIERQKREEGDEAVERDGKCDERAEEHSDQAAPSSGGGGGSSSSSSSSVKDNMRAWVRERARAKMGRSVRRRPHQGGGSHGHHHHRQLQSSLALQSPMAPRRERLFLLRMNASAFGVHGSTHELGGLVLGMRWARQQQQQQQRSINDVDGDDRRQHSPEPAFSWLVFLSHSTGLRLPLPLALMEQRTETCPGFALDVPWFRFEFRKKIRDSRYNFPMHLVVRQSFLEAVTRQIALLIFIFLFSFSFFFSFSSSSERPRGASRQGAESLLDEPAEHAVVRGDARHPGAALGDGGALGTRGLPGRPSGEGLRHGALLLLGASQRPCPRMGRGGRRRNQRCLVRVERRATKR